MADQAVPKQQKAAIKEGFGQDTTILIKNVDVPELKPGQILVKINYSGLCASDKSFLYDEMAAFGATMGPASGGIAGHEGAGVVVAMAPDVERAASWKIGDRAGIKWIVDVCGHCDYCRETDTGGEVLCMNQTNSGRSTPGTFAEYCATSARYATRIPDGVSDEEAGPLMCGGVTAYAACKRTGLKPGQWLVVSGAGGGLGHLAIQYAKVMGMRVIAIDGGDEKRHLCLKLGAEHFIDFTKVNDIPAKVMGITKLGAHGVVVTAASKAGYENILNLLRGGGTLVAVGLPGDPSVVAGAHPVKLCMKKLNIAGSVVGTMQDVDECLDFTARGLVKPILTHGTLDELGDLCKKMSKGSLVGRAVLKISS